MGNVQQGYLLILLITLYLSTLLGNDHPSRQTFLGRVWPPSRLDSRMGRPCGWIGPSVLGEEDTFEGGRVVQTHPPSTVNRKEAEQLPSSIPVYFGYKFAIPVFPYSSMTPWQ